MRYLLDVNALIALGFLDHEFHERVVQWLKKEQFPPLLTCSITELGFARILAQASAYGHTIGQAATLLTRLKASPKFSLTFVADTHDITHLPAWVKTPKHLTDGHLVQLASAYGAVLATLDEKVTGAYLIPLL
jgi:predicted nucleic acid-binding protein